MGKNKSRQQFWYHRCAKQISVSMGTVSICDRFWLVQRICCSLYGGFLYDTIWITDVGTACHVSVAGILFILLMRTVGNPICTGACCNVILWYHLANLSVNSQPSENSGDRIHLYVYSVYRRPKHIWLWNKGILAVSGLLLWGIIGWRCGRNGSF